LSVRDGPKATISPITANPINNPSDFITPAAENLHVSFASGNFAPIEAGFAPTGTSWVALVAHQ